MAANGTKKTTSPLSIIAILAVLGGVYYASRTQLKSSRPEAPVGLTHVVSEEDKIDARLWQDPLKVACEHEKTMHRTEKSKADVYVSKVELTPWLNHERAKHAEEISEYNSYVREISAEHSLGQIKKRIDSNSPLMQQKSPDVNTRLHILLTMVRDGITAEDHERRLRNRYAMLTALHSSGLVPEDAMHIRYFRLPWIERNELEEKIVHDKYSHIPKIVEDCNYRSEPLIVPYEWFEKEEVYLSQISDTGEDDRPENVLLVWLAESAFSHRPLTRLAQVIDALDYTLNIGITIDVIGPSHSGTLRAMLSETREIYMNEIQFADYNCVDVNLMLKDLTIFSPWSTASPALLVKGWPYQDPNQDSLSQMYEVIPSKFEEIGIKFVRMIGSDDLLAMELMNELKRRGVDVFSKDAGGKEHHIALISEWDTFYGNAFPLTFATMMKSINPETGEPYSWNAYTSNLNQREHSRTSSILGNLHIYSYIRGVDGRLAESKSSEGEKSNDNSADTSKLTFTKGLELPTSRSQLDYIRRLTQKLSDEYKYFGNNKLKAIGVVGSDVYDKLVLLQALREQFSDMIIFTIDIDARMLYHEQLKWTRNVIVASNYGLELSDSYQSRIFQHREGSLSPFRDSYQTSLFLACQTALTLSPGDPNDIRLFREMKSEEFLEILSHPRLFEIGRGRAVDLSVSSGKSDIKIHPPRIRWRGLKDFITKMSLILMVLWFCILLVAIISPGAKEILPLMSIKRWERNSIGVKLLVLAVIGFIGIVIFDHYREGGEPFSLDAGVSIWPGEILRLIAVILGSSLLLRLVNKLKKSEEKLAEDFNLPKKPDKKRQHTSSWERLKGHFSWKRMEKSCGLVFFLGLTNETEKSVNAQQIWNDYLKDSKWGYRFLRSVPMALGYMLLSGAVIYLFGLPNTPFRGNISFIVNNIILCLSGVYMTILIFFVVDATRLCLDCLTGPLIEFYTIWPDDATEKIKDDWDIEPKEYAELLDVRFVTKLTEDIGKMIYWPFIVLAVMVASRFPYFDNWNFPISLIIAYSIASIYLIICAIALQRTAKRVRAKALDYLNKRLHAARFGKNENEKRAIKLTSLITEIESMREGAFRPFFENPVVHVLLGSGGGLLALLEYIPLS